MLQEQKKFCSCQYPNNVVKVANKVFAYMMFQIIFFARRTLFWMKLGTFQFVFLRPVLMFLSVVLWTNGNYAPYNVSKYFKQRWSTGCIGFRADVSILVYN